MVEKLSISDPYSLELASKVLREGGVVVYPTETVYALSANALNEDAVARIFKIKGRDVKIPFSVFIEKVEALPDYAQVNKIEERIAKKFMPGQITLVLSPKNQNRLAKNINISGEKIGFRIPANKFAVELLAMSKLPLIGTSANLSGDNLAARDHNRILDSIGEKIDLLIYDENFIADKPSTVLEIVNNEIKIHRQGPISLEQLELAVKS